ncbi:MAG: RibD family protein [Geobacteraceae bacterium]|nr:RibD family protein [Geobacteraceae bacterium]
MDINQEIEHWLSSRKKAFQSSRRPFVTLSYAQSWGGSITTIQGQPLALSGAESTRLTHQLRSLHDGILVGIETVLSDDPQLTVRHWHGKNPQPIVLDTSLRMPASLTVAPLLLGGYKAINNLGTTTLEELPCIDPLHTQRLGNDLIVWGDIRYEVPA